MASKIFEVKEQLQKSLHDETKPWTKLFASMERKTGVDRLYVCIGLAAVIGVWLVIGFAAQLVCNFVGFVYPAYASMHALESPNKDDDAKWLMYWVVFSMFSVTEFFADFIVGWISSYWLLKCVFLIWLMVPIKANGSIYLYKSFIKPMFIKHQNQIDEALLTVTKTAKEFLDGKIK